MTVEEFKALSYEERDKKAAEQVNIWRRTQRLNRRRETSRTAVEKMAVLEEFNTLIDGADLIVP